MPNPTPSLIPGLPAFAVDDWPSSRMAHALVSRRRASRRGTRARTSNATVAAEAARGAWRTRAALRPPGPVAPDVGLLIAEMVTNAHGPADRSAADSPQAR